MNRAIVAHPDLAGRRKGLGALTCNCKNRVTVSIDEIVESVDAYIFHTASGPVIITDESRSLWRSALKDLLGDTDAEIVVPTEVNGERSLVLVADDNLYVLHMRDDSVETHFVGAPEGRYSETTTRPAGRLEVSFTWRHDAIPGGSLTIEARPPQSDPLREEEVPPVL